MNTKILLSLFLLLVLPAPAPAQPPPRLRPPPPADRPRPPRERLARTNERPHRAGGQLLPSIVPPEKFRARPGPQIGLNFIRFFWSESRREPPAAALPDVYRPDTVFRDLESLGATAYRQFVKADLLWDVVESAAGQWTFSNADAVIPNAAFVPVPTLFAMQYASATPPWETDPAKFQKTLGPEARHYIETVVRRYAPHVKYWELGNEMEHWRAADPDDEMAGRRSERLPASIPADGFSPREQGRFLAQAAAIVRANDPDAVILLPGMAGLDDYTLDTWLPGVVAGGGKNWFDIVNYHYYSNWESFVMRRPRLAAALKRLGIDDKPVWQTETGSSSDPALTLRTDYPNSPETQAADVFRRIVQGYGHGDSFVMWHCYIPSPPHPQSEWRAYGVRDPQGAPTLAGRAFRLLTGELIPWSSVERLEADPRGRNIYRFTLADGAKKIVAWGAGTCPVPAGLSQSTSVLPAPSGAFAWRPVQPGDVLELSSTPILLK